MSNPPFNQQSPDQSPDSNLPPDSILNQPDDLPPEPPQKPSRKRLRWRWVWLFLLALLLSLVAVLGWMTSTEEGSKKLLALLTSRQTLITYTYNSGDLQKGVILTNIKVQTKSVDVLVRQARLKIGWRAIVQRELHFRYASLDDLRIVKKTPSSDKPFDFKQLKLPFTLRFDEGFVHGLTIQTKPTSRFKFDEVVLHDAVWSDTRLALENSSLKLPYLSAQQITGHIEFHDKYPLKVDGQLNIPALNKINVQQIYVAGRGTLDVLRLGLAVPTPKDELFKGAVLMHPVRKDVPFKGQLDWRNFHWPIAESQALFSKSGSALIDGTTAGLNATLQTDLSGKSIPAGSYQGQLATNYKSLDIQALNARLMGGSLQTQGFVNWQNKLSWDITGRANSLNAKDPTVPEAVRDYLPPVISGQLYSKGELSQLAKLYVALKLDSRETWLAGIARQGSLGNSAQPLWIDARWQNINRQLPMIGALNSPSGRVLLSLPQNRLNASIDANVAANSQGLLPSGRYRANINKKANVIVIPDVTYQGMAGKLQGNATVNLPKAKQGLVWRATLQTQDFNPSRFAAAVPFTRLNGVINATGRGSENRQLISLTNTRLTGIIPASNGQASRSVELSGNASAALIMYPKRASTQRGANQSKAKAANQPSGLKSFAVQFNGDLKTPDVPDGDLVIKLSGTPKLINISEFRHDGAAGKINLTGQVNLNQGAAWQLKGLLDQFNPGFFVNGYAGWVSGNFNTTGHWQTNRKDLQLTNLNLNGMIKNQPVIGRGSLQLTLPANTKAGFMPTRFEAQNLLLSFAGNQVFANGNSNRLVLDVNAPALNQLYSGITGKVIGKVMLTGDERQPDASINLRIDRFAFKNQLTIQQANLIGRIPQMGRLPGQLQLDIQNLKRGTQTLRQGRILLAGSKAAHVVQLSGSGINPATRFGLQLAGGFNAANDWLGQLQQGNLATRQLNLVQGKPAALIYKSQTKAIFLDQHCWAGTGSKLCLIEPLQASSAKGVVSVQLQNLDIGSFQAFMPQGVAWMGKMFGHAKVTWLGNSSPTLNAQIYTDNGEIGLAPEDPQDEPLTLPYQRLSLIAITQPDGIKLRFDAKTPGIGTGYIDATINPRATPKTVNGALVLDNVQVSIFKPFFPGMRVLNGVASLAGGVSGPLTAPDFFGEFRLRDGQVAMNNLPINLNRINLSSSIRGTEASLTGNFYSGDGQAQLTGAANWQGVPYINLSLAGERLLIRQAPMLTARVTPKIEARILPTEKQLSVNGTIDVPSAVISMPQSSEDIIAKSGDVRVVRSDQIDERVMKAARPWAINADIDVTLGDNIYFRGFGTSIPLGGKLNLSQRGLNTAMRGNGAIGVRQNVTIEAFGQRLQLNRGIARFNGIITQPSLDIDATKSVSNRTIGVRVTGRATNPSIAVYNDAGLSEQEALNALLTGRISSANPTVNNTAGFKSEVNNTIAAAGISLGLGGTRNFTNRLGRTFGLDSLTLDAEGVGDDTQVSLTGYITPDLYLRYGVGVFTPVNRLTLRYQLNRRLYVEASSALDRAVDMFYNWRF